MSGVLRRLRQGVWRQGIGAPLVASALAVLGMAGHAAEAGQPATPTSEQPDPQRLVGRWVRPDGGYILEVREVVKESSLKAAYLNPRPINVARAESTRKDGRLMVFVEFRDVNYPGSTYALLYDPASDRLKGTYFQAVAKQTYDVEFVRTR